MTQILMDPVEMKASAGVLGEQAMRIQETVTGTRTTCSCEVPRSLIAWLDEELNAITVSALQVAVGYLTEAVDTAQRAQQIEADQSLATTQVSPAPTTMTIGGPSPIGVVTGGSPAMTSMTIGGNSWYDDISTTYVGPTTVTIGGPGSYERFLADNPLLVAAQNLRSTNPAASAQLFGVHSQIAQSQADMIGRDTNSRPGASYIGGGLYEGSGGRVGTISDVYRNPDRPGEYEVL